MIDLLTHGVPIRRKFVSRISANYELPPEGRTTNILFSHSLAVGGWFILSLQESNARASANPTNFSWWIVHTQPYNAAASSVVSVVPHRSLLGFQMARASPSVGR